tara:strand:- start:279 stop:455 length:177 start_codon:yes stop_codon:yes gene_type:complete
MGTSRPLIDDDFLTTRKKLSLASATLQIRTSKSTHFIFSKALKPQKDWIRTTNYLKNQ